MGNIMEQKVIAGRVSKSAQKKISPKNGDDNKGAYARRRRVK